MRISVVDPNFTSSWMEAHKEGCQHLGTRKPVQWAFEAETRNDAAREIAQDFIHEGSMALEDALRAIHWAPCLAKFK